MAYEEPQFGIQVVFIDLLGHQQSTIHVTSLPVGV